MNQIDPNIAAAATEMSRRAGAQLRQDLLKADYTCDEINEIVRRAFAWLHDGELAREISNLAHTLDDYEATIALAYIKRLIKSRAKRDDQIACIPGKQHQTIMGGEFCVNCYIRLD
jgi:hypothetical protein